ncbi:flagellar hook protein FlgE [Halodesulfovibrio sp. MK-HDV]|jgi:flagellar hook protein FlgE|uniref:flagellar hook protein FlgE n=1 Tax=unclassified Halodesulfovibrio TaxID=2644657 RepID=UPI0013680962|nr:flagellar hook protein FlgE [Halodesulfovibrio sp. MK-HDV]KAF1075720.1 Flagellar hook protein FlgE [Halodesulfovibrio sp. MK-HDV]
MSVMGSMYTGISGLTTHAERMSVLGNNIANTSTVGFKSGNVQFEDLFYSSKTLGASVGQIGHGARVSSIYQDFSQGAYENTGSVTDVALGGRGFFMVNDSLNGSKFYTRAGNFNFNKEGYLVNPQGLRVQGWEAGKTEASVTKGAIGDLKLDSFQSEPKESSIVSLSINLSKKAVDKTTPAVAPTGTQATDMFALFSKWDGSASPTKPLGDDAYSYQKTINVFDKAGSAHEVTVYFDKARDKDGKLTWEYIVTTNPDEDGRTAMEVPAVVAPPAAAFTRKAKGLLMAGTMSFNSAGAMENMSAYTYDAGALATPANADAKASWKPAEFDENGFPIFTANFSNLTGVNDTNDVSSGEKPERIALDFGMSSKSATKQYVNATQTMADAETNVANIASIATADINKTNKSATSYDLASTTHSMNQDGYTAGFLQEVTVDRNGVVSGRYSNGRREELFVLGLADFANRQGLSLQGGNLFAQSTSSGEAVIGTANTGRLGTVSSNTLELSNVDMSRQMVKLITTQRGYQSNSKVITTSDEMLQEAINLKR